MIRSCRPDSMWFGVVAGEQWLRLGRRDCGQFGGLETPALSRSTSAISPCSTYHHAATITAAAPRSSVNTNPANVSADRAFPLPLPRSTAQRLDSVLLVRHERFLQ